MNTYTVGETIYNFGIVDNVFTITVSNQYIGEQTLTITDNNEVFVEHSIIQNITILNKVLKNAFTENSDVKLTMFARYPKDNWTIRITIHARNPMIDVDEIELKLKKVDRYVIPKQVVEYIDHKMKQMNENTVKLLMK